MLTRKGSGGFGYDIKIARVLELGFEIDWKGDRCDCDFV